MSYQKTVAVDFDGTLCDHEFPRIGKVKKGAREALETLRALGYRIVIWSCRTSKHNAEEFAERNADGTINLHWLANPMSRPTVGGMVAFLSDEGIPYDEIDDGSKGKPFAEFYLDDKAIRVQDNWAEIAAAIGRLERA